MKSFKPRITSKRYVKLQILKCLDESIIYQAQIRVVAKTLEDPNRKENSMKALTALNQQLAAGRETLNAWLGLYQELEKENSLIFKIKKLFKKIK